MITAMKTPLDAARPVGVFDSGVGGLTVLHELLVRLPQEDYVYLGDTAHFPYGERDAEQIARFAVAIADVLLRRGAKLLVVACNAASAAALPALREHLAEIGSGVEVIGVVDAAARQAVAQTHNGRVGLLATPAAVHSGAYRRAVDATGEWIELVSVACPDLAPLIQSGFPFDAEVMDTVRAYCRPLRDAGVDTVILGCTHYPLVAPMLQRMLGPEITLVGSGESVARTVQRALAARGLARGGRSEGSYDFLCTGDVTAFEALGSRFLQMPLGGVEQVDLTAAAAAAVSSTAAQQP